MAQITETGTIDLKAQKAGHDDAAKTATNYIGADSTGIRIANADPDTATTYQHQTATETEFVVNGVSVAEFGGEGGRVGAADAGHLTLTEDSMTITNADGVSAFNVDLDCGVAYSYATEPAETASTVRDIRATTSGYTLNYSRVTDVSGAVTGTTITGGSGQVLLLQMYSDETANFSISSATVSSGMNVSGHNSKTLYVNVTQQRTATAGTSKTITRSATGIRWGSAQRTLDVVSTWAYDAAAGTLTERVAVTFKAESTLYYGFSQLKRTLRKLQYRVSSTAPAFSLGTRALDSTIGAFSAIVGEDLHATQPNQVAIGKYNAEDTNGDYALIIGNGTADDARSNALAVTWDGDVYGGSGLSCTPVVLFDDDAQALSGAVTLAETAANFSRLVICYRSNDGDYGSTEVWHPDGKTVSLLAARTAGGGTPNVYLKSKTVLISGTTIDTVSYQSGGNYYATSQARVDGNNAAQRGDYIAITQVIGYR